MSRTATYESRHIRRPRRSKADIRQIKDAIIRILEAGSPMTVRQVFYRLVVSGIIEKTQSEYKSTVVRLLADLRRDGEVPFGWITDGTRVMRKPRSYSSLEEALDNTAATYRRALWSNQDAYVEVWCESAAVAGVLHESTAAWDVPLMAAGGFSSLTFLHSAAECIAAVGKPTYIYYFGDHDPSGVHIDRKIESGLRTYAPHAEIHFERVAVTPAQIEHWELPGTPKKQTDSRSKSFDGDAVEIESIDPEKLRTICNLYITGHIDDDAHESLKAVEEAERATACEIASALRKKIHRESSFGLEGQA